MVLSFKFPEPVFCSVTRENDVELPHETLVLSFKKKTKKKTPTQVTHGFIFPSQIKTTAPSLEPVQKHMVSFLKFKTTTSEEKHGFIFCQI